MKPIIFCSCGGNDIKEQSEIDSLRNELAQKTAELEMANDFVDLYSINQTSMQRIRWQSFFALVSPTRISLPAFTIVWMVWISIL